MTADASEAAVSAGARALWTHRNRFHPPATGGTDSPEPDHIDRMMAKTVLVAALPVVESDQKRIADAALEKLKRLELELANATTALRNVAAEVEEWTGEE